MRRALVVILLGLAACSGGEDKKIAQARSWSATAMLVAESWLRGEVPAAYARDALKKAADELATGAYPDASRPVADLEGAIARGDRAEARRLVEELRR